VNQGQVDKVAERDRLDSSRKTAPLSQTPGAIPIDTTHLTLNEVAAKMAQVITGRLAAA
jgi:cytidylate kinase